MSNELKYIFEKTDCVSTEMLLKYHRGELSNAEKHRVERHLLTCNACSDELEGIELAGDLDAAFFSDLSQWPENKKVKKAIFDGRWKLLAAAAITILVLLTSVITLFVYYPVSDTQLAQEIENMQNQPASEQEEKTRTIEREDKFF
ncbi:MAG: hypothetical protein C0594_12295, partial [Marinilabiliales bacterium]